VHPDTLACTTTYALAADHPTTGGWSSTSRTCRHPVPARDDGPQKSPGRSHLRTPGPTSWCPQKEREQEKVREPTIRQIEFRRWQRSQTSRAENRRSFPATGSPHSRHDGVGMSASRSGHGRRGAPSALKSDQFRHPSLRQSSSRRLAWPTRSAIAREEASAYNQQNQKYFERFPGHPRLYGYETTKRDFCAPMSCSKRWFGRKVPLSRIKQRGFQPSCESFTSAAAINGAIAWHRRRHHPPRHDPMETALAEKKLSAQNAVACVHDGPIL